MQDMRSGRRRVKTIDKRRRRQYQGRFKKRKVPSRRGGRARNDEDRRKSFTATRTQLQPILPHPPNRVGESCRYVLRHRRQSRMSSSWTGLCEFGDLHALAFVCHDVDVDGTWRRAESAIMTLSGPLPLTNFPSSSRHCLKKLSALPVTIVLDALRGSQPVSEKPRRLLLFSRQLMTETMIAT